MAGRRWNDYYPKLPAGLWKRLENISIKPDHTYDAFYQTDLHHQTVPRNLANVGTSKTGLRPTECAVKLSKFCNFCRKGPAKTNMQDPFNQKHPCSDCRATGPKCSYLVVKMAANRLGAKMAIKSVVKPFTKPDIGFHQLSLELFLPWRCITLGSLPASSIAV